MRSSSDLAIKTDKLSKIYSKTDIKTKKNTPFYALKDVNFELEKGEVLGIIGTNGSGKSTLLRILSGITKPSQGKVEIYGRVASILDIGTGFHPDLSGRENTYLRGQLLGMHRPQIDLVFDELVSFSGITEFIDTPVKHYSSGMFLRLAFSIIIHLKAEILLLDEVMSVGDIDFQEKCRSKLDALTEKGNTIIIVTHELNRIQSFIDEAMILDEGRIKDKGKPNTLIQKYILENLKPEIETEKEGSLSKRIKWNSRNDQPGNKRLKVLSIELQLEGGESVIPLESLAVELNIETLAIEDEIIELAISVSDLMGNILMIDSPDITGKYKKIFDHPGKYKILVSIPGNLLGGNLHKIGLYLAKRDGKLIYKNQTLLWAKSNARGKSGIFAGLGSIRTPHLDWTLFGKNE
jgi:homopolymeric O-antigen transport system ATP-binding protein